MDHKEKISALPNSPGVYMMKGSSGEVLYVGKAGNLRKRVSSYFREHSRLTERIRALVPQVSDIAHIKTSSEAEALIYENSLIKQYSPKYNIALKDGKSYPLLKLTVDEAYPRLYITRQRKADGAVYFGPYTNTKLLRGAVSLLKRIFPLRTCKRMPAGVCLEYHIKQCLGPCAGKIDEAGYKSLVSELKLFLGGRQPELLLVLSEKMKIASKMEDFEEASRIRDRIEALGAVNKGGVRYGPHAELDELRDLLGIKKDIETIEAFDVSNTMGKDAVGSMISFYKGRPRKEEYRKFKIKTVVSINDYDMMRELVSRRYSRLSIEGRRMPDLILIDGGKGHLNSALDELRRLGLGKIPAIGIAKEFEHIYTKDRIEPIVLPKESKALHLLKRVRDEAHRFAVAYHKSLLSKKVSMSELDNIPGIGKKRKRALINHFGSLDRLISAGPGELMDAEGMNARAAESVIEYFKKR